ncbi:MAG: DJ-1/PfpI family protein [Erythrobacter sp.]|nr:DJ-1/PfpI family protein [Erythrobacter sp.]
MDRRQFLAGSLVLGGAGPLLGCAPPASRLTSSSIAQIPADEHAATIAALKPPKRARPVIAVVIDEEGSETTDTIVPHAVLALSGLADVHVVGARTEPVSLFPALTIVPQLSFGEFGGNYPESADYVIVPASHRIKSPTLVPWIRQQAEQKATVIGICAGARTVAAAGLLKGRRGTTHWYEVGDLKKDEPELIPVSDRRYVVDDGVVTTTGVTASIPVSLALVEAIGGQEKARALAGRLGVSCWTAAHASSAFSVTAQSVWAALSGRIAFWNRDEVVMPVSDQVSAISLALAADAWSRTDRSRAFAVSAEQVITMDSGLQLAGLSLAPDKVTRTVEISSDLPAQSLDRMLKLIGEAYGEDIARYVAIQVEYMG